MASEVKTNKLSPSTGVTVTLGDASDVFQLPASAEIDIASGATLDVNGTIDVTGAIVTGLTTGKVLQVLHFPDVGPGDTTTNSSYVNTSTAGSITCSATTSKVFIMINGSSTGYRASDANQYNAAICVYETVTAERFPGGATDWGFGRAVIHITAHADNRYGGVQSGFWLHSPSSIAELTYTVQQRNPGLTSVYWNETAAQTATITLMEIGA